MSEKQTPQKTQKPQRHPGIIAIVIFTAFKIILFSMLACVVLTLWFAGETLFYSESFVLQQADALLNLNQNFITTNHTLWNNVMIAWFNTVHSWINQSVNFTLRASLEMIKPFFVLGLYATEIDLVRLLSYGLALPLVALLIIVFTTDGLVKRDIRKFQGARESTFKFHRSKHALQYVLFAPFFIYLCLPLSIPPTLYLLAHAFIIGFVSMLMAKNFKKYV